MGHVYNIKKQFKVQIIVILEEIYPFYWPKMHLWKGDKKFGQAPPPSFGQNPKEQQFFLRKPSLIIMKIVTMIVMMPTMKEMPDLLRALGRNSTIHTHHPFSHLFSFIFLLFCWYLYFFQYLGFEFWSHFDLNCRNPTRDELNTIMAEVRHFIIEWLVLFVQPLPMVSFSLNN